MAGEVGDKDAPGLADAPGSGGNNLQGGNMVARKHPEQTEIKITVRYVEPKDPARHKAAWDRVFEAIIEQELRKKRVKC